MRRTGINRILSLLLCVVLIAALALCAAGCGKTQPAAGETAVYSVGQPLGEGETQFTLTVADDKGSELLFTINTNAATVGEALQALNLIDGEEGDYGLYIKTVNGVTADYDADGTYWAFYIDGEYAMTGVDATAVEPGAAYALRVEK